MNLGYGICIVLEPNTLKLGKIKEINHDNYQYFEFKNVRLVKNILKLHREINPLKLGDNCDGCEEFYKCLEMLWLDFEKCLDKGICVAIGIDQNQIGEMILSQKKILAELWLPDILSF